MGLPYLTERKPQYTGEVLVGNARYEGYAMDLIGGIAEILNFTFEFRINKDYGKPDPNTGKWNGLIGEVIERVGGSIIYFLKKWLPIFLILESSSCNL